MPKTGRLTAQVRWLGLRVDGCLALVYIHQIQMNRVNSRNDLWSWWQHYKHCHGYYYYYYQTTLPIFTQFGGKATMGHRRNR